MSKNNQNWTDIDVFPISLPFHNGKTYRRTPNCNWCNADSIFHVRRKSVISGNTYTDYACETCAKPWQKAQKEQEKELTV
jgi:hypothetical protein